MLDNLRLDRLHCKSDRLPVWLHAVEFSVYSLAAISIHAMIAIPAVITRLVTDLSLGMNLFQAVKPQKRSDLF